MSRADEALFIEENWTNTHELHLAPQKTEAVILKGKIKTDYIRFDCMGLKIALKKSLKYLGVVMCKRSTFREHIKTITKKANERAAALSRLWPNIWGPTNKRTAVLNTALQSTLLYTAPIWYSVVRVRRYKDKLTKKQRLMLIKITTSYRIASTKALQEITGTVPIHLLIRCWKESDYTISPTNIQQSIRLWQEDWDSTINEAQWTKKLTLHIHRKVNSMQP